jgi:3-oxoacyl-[acyl-carrier-protein] synthase II
MNVPSEPERRVVITGLGVFSPIGIGKEAFWENLIHGRSGIDLFSQFSSHSLPVHVAGEVKDFDPQKHIPQRKSLKLMCRDIQLGVAAALMAVRDAAIEPGAVDPTRLGVEYGASLMFTNPEEMGLPVAACLDETGRFHFEQWAQDGMREMFPLWLLKYLPNMPACHVAIFCDAQGPNNTITEREASGNLAVGEAYRVIARGGADIMISAATGSRVHPVGTVQACMIEELSSRNGDPTTASRPFDRDRDGMVVGEGAGCLVLEEREHALRRGARIYAEIVGVGSACCARTDGTFAWDKALALAMRNAMNHAHATPDDVGHINAHGVSTRLGDEQEARAILETFGPRGETVPVLAMKSYFGNLGAGTGAVELAGSVLALEHGVLPYTLNYEVKDPNCPLNVVSGRPQPIRQSSFLNTNVTRVGQASCLMVVRHESS